MQGDRLQSIGALRAALHDLFEFERYQWDERDALTLTGRLLQPADQVYRTIRARIEPLGWTPFLQRQGENDVLLALPGVIQHRPPRFGLPLALFLITVISTTLNGALNETTVCTDDLATLGNLLLATLASPAAMLRGLPFAATLLGILLAHEMGHYLVGRLRRAPVSPPYFIPLPPPLSFTGTMGAVIVQREPMEDRKTILEIGLAGPFAGLIVAFPLIIFGLATSPVGPPPAPPPGCPPGYLQEGNSILYGALKLLVYGRMLPANGVDVQLNAVAWGAWIGLLVTMLNLLPVGQLDGGHAAYALLGRRADYLAYGMVALCFVLGVTISQTWLIWGVLALLIGPRHPPPLNDISTLGPRHVAFAVLGLLTFVLLFMPSPLVAVGG
jgi:membrane-associated protease RseP (regulator of RpoE activity)